MKLYIVTGISGSGKTTVARQLVANGEVAFDSKLQPDIYHFVDAQGNVAKSVQLADQAWRATYKWSLNEQKLDELLQLYKDAPRVFLCGKANLFQYWHKAEKVFLLKVDAQTLQQRLNSESRDNLFAKDAATQLALVDTLDALQDKIIQKGAVEIDATLPIEQVVAQIVVAAQE